MSPSPFPGTGTGIRTLCCASGQAVPAGRAALPRQGGQPEPQPPLPARFYLCKGAPALHRITQSQRGCGGTEPAGSKRQRLARQCPLVPLWMRPACRLPACPSGCSNGMDQPRGGWVITLTLDFWRGRQVCVPPPWSAPPGERCHRTNSPTGLCRDVVRKPRSRMRPRQEQGLEPCCHHFDWSLAPTCL